MPDNLNTTPRLFADDTSLFQIIVDSNNSQISMNNDLNKINNWAFQWKMSFNPDPNKQACAVLFSRKKQQVIHPDLTFNNSPVSNVVSQKHLGLILDNRLSFTEHLNSKLPKINKGIGLIKHLSKYLPRKSLLCIYKSFIRPHLDYGDVIYDQPNNIAFCTKIETFQYNAALAITGAIRGTSRNKLYKELGLESLAQRRWFRKMCLFFKIVNGLTPKYLSDILPRLNRSRNPIRAQQFYPFDFNTNYFINSFFPYSVHEWNKLDPCIKNLTSFSLFKKALLKNIRPQPIPIFDVMDPPGLKLLTRVRLGLSHLKEHKFNFNFLDTPNPLCNCGLLEVESTSHFFLRCNFYINIRQQLLNDISDIIGRINNIPEKRLLTILLYGDSNLSNLDNANILKLSIAFLKNSGRFDMPLLTA